MANWQTATVLEKRVWEDGLFSLILQHELDSFRAGQFIKLGMMVGEERIERPYSLVNSDRDSHAEILFNQVEEGSLTPLLAELEKGDQLLATTDAHGFLVVDEIPDVPHLWMMATGTGIGPFVSILNSEQSKRFERIVIVHGTTTASGLAYRGLFESLEHLDERISYFPVTSRETTEGCLSGRLTDHIESGELEKSANLTLDNENSHVLLCGNIQMIRDVQKMLELRDMKKHRRFDPGHISIEKYH